MKDKDDERRLPTLEEVSRAYGFDQPPSPLAVRSQPTPPAIGIEEQGRRLAEAWARNRGELVRGDVVAADEVPSRSLVRDGDGTFYHRRDQFGQVARGAGPWRVWGDVKRFHWFKRGLFEIVALDVREAAAAAELAELGREHEAQFGVPEFGSGSLMVKVSEVREVVRIALSNRPKDDDLITIAELLDGLDETSTT